MSKRSFTDQELQLLRENPYTYRVTPNTLSFTKVFKEHFYEEYLAGKLPREILEDCGYPAEILGKQRIWGISHCIKKEYETHGRFHEGILSKDSTANDAEPMSAEESIRHLQHEVEYLKQEMEFLKKISSIRNTRK